MASPRRPGRPGKFHLYVRLDDLVEAAELSELQPGLVAYVGADPSPSALNGYLRPPGSLNHKPALLDGMAPAELACLADAVDPRFRALVLTARVLGHASGRTIGAEG